MLKLLAFIFMYGVIEHLFHGQLTLWFIPTVLFCNVLSFLTLYWIGPLMVKDMKINIKLYHWKKLYNAEPTIPQEHKDMVNLMDRETLITYIRLIVEA